jgi:hypothetical protein
MPDPLTLVVGSPLQTQNITRSLHKFHAQQGTPANRRKSETVGGLDELGELFISPSLPPRRRGNLIQIRERIAGEFLELEHSVFER